MWVWVREMVRERERNENERVTTRTKRAMTQEPVHGPKNGRRDKKDIVAMSAQKVEQGSTNLKHAKTTDDK